MDWIAEARKVFGLEDVDPAAFGEPAETTQQKAVRLSREARDMSTPGPVAPQAQDAQEAPQQLRDTQAAALPDPASKARLKQKLRVMLERRG